MGEALKLFFAHEMEPAAAGGGLEEAGGHQEAEVISLPVSGEAAEETGGWSLSARQQDVAVMFEVVKHPMSIGIAESNLRRTGHNYFNFQNVAGTIGELVELGILWEPESGIYALTCYSLEQYEEFAYGSGEPEEDGEEDSRAANSRPAA